MSCLRCTANSTPSATSFLRLASKRSAASPAPLEFLVPRHALTSRQYTPAPVRRFNSGLSSGTFTRNSLPNKARAFTTTIPRKATICVQNPQQDEDGNPMVLEITARAAKRLSDIMTKDKNPNLALRIQVESGGCHGFQYLMSLITMPAKTAKDTAEASSIVNEDDAIFQYQAGEGESSVAPGVVPTIILDEPSLDLLKGSKVDFTQELIGSQFKIVDNPYASSSCGCGTSFDIKM